MKSCGESIRKNESLKKNILGQIYFYTSWMDDLIKDQKCGLFQKLIILEDV